jgi:hypothetical protein
LFTPGQDGTSRTNALAVAERMACTTRLSNAQAAAGEGCNLRFLSTAVLPREYHQMGKPIDFSAAASGFQQPLVCRRPAFNRGVSIAAKSGASHSLAPSAWRTPFAMRWKRDRVA